MPARVLVVTFDSAEPQLVRAWAEEGLLPNLAKLLAVGQSREIENLPGFGNGVFWPCIYTGADPSFHGGYYLCQPKPPGYAVEPFTKYDYLMPPFWTSLEADGFDVAVMDPVECPIGRLSRGVEVLDWNVHRRESAPQSTPPELIGHILERHGEDPFHGNVVRTVKAETPPEGLSAMSDRRIRMKTDAALEILAERDWDFFMVSYADPHDIGHMAWHLHDPRSPDAAPVADPIKRCYEQLDAALGELMQAASSGGQTLVVMGPGMERNVTGKPLLPEILRAFQGRDRRGIKKLLSQASRAFVKAEWIPWFLRERYRTQRERLGTQVKTKAGHRFYTVPHNDDASAVRINVIGREEHGIVAPGDEYDKVCDDLTERLLNLTDASKKQPAIKEVIRVHKNYQGPAIEQLPDLLVVWNRAADLSAIHSEAHGVFRKEEDPTRTGDHSRRGLVLSDQPIDSAPNGLLSPMQVTPILVGAVQRLATVAA